MYFVPFTCLCGSSWPIRSIDRPSDDNETPERRTVTVNYANSILPEWGRIGAGFFSSLFFHGTRGSMNCADLKRILLDPFSLFDDDLEDLYVYLVNLALWETLENIIRVQNFGSIHLFLYSDINAGMNYI